MFLQNFKEMVAQGLVVPSPLACHFAEAGSRVIGLQEIKAQAKEQVLCLLHKKDVLVARTLGIKNLGDHEDIARAADRVLGDFVQRIPSVTGQVHGKRTKQESLLPQHRLAVPTGRAPKLQLHIHGHH